MDWWLLIYWGIAYTVGIVGLNMLIVLYSQKKAQIDKQFIKFLVGIDCSFVGLSIIEAGQFSAGATEWGGMIALLGAAYTAANIPMFAAMIKMVRLRLQIAKTFRVLGYVCFLLDLAWPLYPDWLTAVARNVSLLLLAAAVTTSLVWMVRSRPIEAGLRSRLWMLLLLCTFVVFTIVDLFRPNFDWLSGLGVHYVTFPGYFILLNFFIAARYALPGLLALGSNRLPVDQSTPDPAPQQLYAPEALARFGISDREAEVLTLLLEGQSYREIADTLYISLSTVKTHVSRLYQKTKTSNKISLLRVLRSA